MFIHHKLAISFWLIAMSLVAFVAPSAAYANAGTEPPTLLLPNNPKLGLKLGNLLHPSGGGLGNELSSVLKVEKINFPEGLVQVNQRMSYTIKVTNVTENVLLDAVVYEILPPESDFEYIEANPSPVMSQPVDFESEAEGDKKGDKRSRILTFRWNNNRIFKGNEERFIKITGIVKKPSTDVKALFSHRFCTAAKYDAMGFCQELAIAELKVFKQFIFENIDGKFEVTPIDDVDGKADAEVGVEKKPLEVPKYPAKFCKNAWSSTGNGPSEAWLSAAEKIHHCIADEECLKCQPKDPERCTFDVNIWAKKC